MSKKERNNGLSGKVVVFIVLIVMILSFGCGLFVGYFASGVKVKTGLVTEQLRKCSELTTINSKMSGEVKIEDGLIPYINKKMFSMSYVAEVKLGVNLKNVKPRIENKTVKVVIPHAKEHSISFIEDGFKFYDVSRAIFNWRNHEDVKVAMKEAKKDVKKKLKKSRAYTKADTYAVETIKRLLTFAEQEGYNIDVTFEE